MYSNDQIQIRQGLVSYIGAIIKSSPFEGRAARHNAAAILTEEAMKLAQNQENDELDFYVLKPLIRGNIHLLKRRLQELSKLPATQEVRKTIYDYQEVIKVLEKLISSLN